MFRFEDFMELLRIKDEETMQDLFVKLVRKEIEFEFNFNWDGTFTYNVWRREK